MKAISCKYMVEDKFGNAFNFDGIRDEVENSLRKIFPHNLIQVDHEYIYTMPGLDHSKVMYIFCPLYNSEEFLHWKSMVKDFKLTEIPIIGLDCNKIED